MGRVGRGAAWGFGRGHVYEERFEFAGSRGVLFESAGDVGFEVGSHSSSSEACRREDGSVLCRGRGGGGRAAGRRGGRGGKVGVKVAHKCRSRAEFGKAERAIFARKVWGRRGWRR